MAYTLEGDARRCLRQMVLAVAIFVIFEAILIASGMTEKKALAWAAAIGGSYLVLMLVMHIYRKIRASARKHA